MSTRSPFKFLDSYTSEDRSIFFGREQEVEELYQKVFNFKKLILYGSSGTGKTSLVQCGLASKFQETDWMPILVRRGENINQSLRTTLSNLAITPIKKAKTLSAYINSVYLDFFKPIFLIFDQFEELFIFGSDEEINSFISELKECLESDLSCRFIFVLRGEYLENISRFENSIPDFFENRMRVERMTRSNASRVITESGAAFGIEISPDFPGHLIDRLSPGRATIELTYLQVYLDKLYKNAQGSEGQPIVFNESLLQKSGMIEDVLAGFLDEQIALTSDAETAMTILKAFVSDEGTKKPSTVQEVADFCRSLGHELKGEQIAVFLKQFVDLRILKDQDDAGRYELRHDALAAKIYEQISLGEKELLEIRQFLLSRYAEYQRRGVLLTDEDALYLTPYINKLFLDASQRTFVEKSQRALQARRNRRRNLLLAAALLLLLVVSGFSLLAIRERNAAQEQAKIAEQKTLEVLKQKEVADAAKHMAEKARLTAEKLKKDAFEAYDVSVQAKAEAVNQSILANRQRQLAEEQEREARHQSRLADEQKKIAEVQAGLARQKSEEALVQKNQAVEAKKEADRLRSITEAQNLAFRSLQFKDEPVVAAYVASMAYKTIKENDGNSFDPLLFNALAGAYGKLIPASTLPLVRFGSAVLAFASGGDSSLQILTADGVIHFLGLKGKAKSKVALPKNRAKADAGFLSDDGKKLITTYPDYSICFWDAANPAVPVFAGKAHRGLVRAVLFGNSFGWSATAGRDSLLVLWKDGKVDSRIHLPSRIRSLACNEDRTVIFAGCESGIVYSVQAGGGKFQELTHVNGGRVQTLHYHGGKLLAGCSNGILRVINLGESKTAHDFNLGNSVEFIRINPKQDMMLAGCNNRIIYGFRWSNLAYQPLHLEDVNPAARAGIFLNDGSLFLACQDNTLRKRNMSIDWLQSRIASEIQPEIRKEEFKKMIRSKDIPGLKTD